MIQLEKWKREYRRGKSRKWKMMRFVLFHNQPPPLSPFRPARQHNIPPRSVLFRNPTPAIGRGDRKCKKNGGNGQLTA